MNKFLVIGDYNFGADVLYVELAALSGDIVLNYYDKQITATGSGSPFTAADVAAINAALVKVWGQGYTDATIDVTLSQAITAIS